MSNPWFRMYSEFVNDPKVQRLSETDQRRYIMLLCLRCSNGDVTLHDEDVTFSLRVTDAEWAATKAVLVERGLIGNDNKPTAWEKRQFASDISAVRVAKHRALHKKACNGDVTLQQQKSNVLDTDTDTDTDTEKTKSISPSPPSASTEKKKTALQHLVELGADAQSAKDWLEVRKLKKAPLTASALADFQLEAGKAGITVGQAVAICAKKSWQGFKASWEWQDALLPCKPGNSMDAFMRRVGAIPA